MLRFALLVAMAAAFIPVLVQPPAAHALYCTSFPTSESAADADVVVVGTIESVGASSTKIEATLAVERYLKGEGGSGLTFRAAPPLSEFVYIDGAWRPTAEDVGKRYLLVLNEQESELVAGWCDSALPLDVPQAAQVMADVTAVTGPGEAPPEEDLGQDAALDPDMDGPQPGAATRMWGALGLTVVVLVGGMVYLRRKF